jgi:hypothetical protein
MYTIWMNDILTCHLPRFDTSVESRQFINDYSLAHVYGYFAFVSDHTQIYRDSTHMSNRGEYRWLSVLHIPYNIYTYITITLCISPHFDICVGSRWIIAINSKGESYNSMVCLAVFQYLVGSWQMVHQEYISSRLVSCVEQYISFTAL